MVSVCGFQRVFLRAFAAACLLASAAIARGAEPQLPDLIAWASQSKCYMYCGLMDSDLIPNKVLYRFIGALPNVGVGPLEIREVTHPDATQDVYQRIYDTDGGVTEVLIGTFPNAASIPPRHLWLPGIAQYNLRTVLPGNEVGPIVSTHDKTSMAVVDSDDYNTSLPGAPQNSVYSNISAPLLGISIGWADVYGLGLPGQWVEATGLADGQYWLEVTVDPYNRIQESNETNNTTLIKVNLVVPDPQILPGDYDDDGTVDAADYTVWRDTLGRSVSIGTAADGDASGVIDGPDYGVWTAHFGDTASGTGAGASAGLPGSAVPEPISFSLASIALAACGLLAGANRGRTPIVVLQ